MSEFQYGDFRARIEERKAEARGNLANAIWTGIKIGVNVFTLKFLWGRFLEHGGTQEELMGHKPKDFESEAPPSQPPQS
jgi:hypothetical protein